MEPRQGFNPVGTIAPGDNPGLRMHNYLLIFGRDKHKIQFNLPPKTGMLN